MTINFNFKKEEEFQNAKKALTNAMANGDEEEQQEAFNNFFDAMQESIQNQVKTELNNDMLDRSMLQSRGQNVLTAEERKFFNAAVQEGGFTDDAILPETTQERVFEDLTTEHPLLGALGLRDLGAVTRFIYSDPEKAYAWGELFGDIRGQVNAAFRDESIEIGRASGREGGKIEVGD